MSFCSYLLVKSIRKRIEARKARKQKEGSSNDSLSTSGTRESYLEDDIGIDTPLFSFKTIAAATNNFDNQNKLGQGGFGPVYKGSLFDGEDIAVKRLSKLSTQGIMEFKNEVDLISKLQHRNLVKLLGCCICGEEKLLVYEFMRNKSLDAFLFDDTNRRQLDWSRRYTIIEGIARGLLYLHRDSRLKIIHRDLKASNVLLDDQFNPKISDFGMARMFGGDQNHETTKRVVGTIGYMSPEYAMEGQISEKSDVFSFGVLLLEIVSGKRNNYFLNDDQALNVVGYAWTLWKENRVLELIDPSLGDAWPQMEVFKCIKLGLLCVQEYPVDRPSMPLVVSVLSSDTSTTLPSPKQAAFFGGSSPSFSISSTEYTEISSTNDATTTNTECK